MVLFNHSTRELTAKIVYYGPGLCGKTTNLKVLHDRLEKKTVGRLLSLATSQDRTIYFDLLPVELGNIKGYTVRFQLCTVPGQVFYNETRKLVLRGVDGIVFVVDSQWSMLSHAHESFLNLKDNLRELDVSLETIPLVIQYNKRDLPSILSIDALQEALSFQSYPHVEAVAAAGKGVMETYKLISKLTFVDLLRRLQRGGGAEADAASALLASAGDHPAFAGEGDEGHQQPAGGALRREGDAQKPKSGDLRIPSPTAKVSPQVASSRETWSSLVTEDDVFGETVPPKPRPAPASLPLAGPAPVPAGVVASAVADEGAGEARADFGPSVDVASSPEPVAPADFRPDGPGVGASGEAAFRPGGPGVGASGEAAVEELPAAAAAAVVAASFTPAASVLPAGGPEGDVFDLSFPSALRSGDLTFPPAPRERSSAEAPEVPSPADEVTPPPTTPTPPGAGAQAPRQEPQATLSAAIEAPVDLPSPPAEPPAEAPLEGPPGMPAGLLARVAALEAAASPLRAGLEDLSAAVDELATRLLETGERITITSAPIHHEVTDLRVRTAEALAKAEGAQVSLRQLQEGLEEIRAARVTGLDAERARQASWEAEAASTTERLAAAEARIRGISGRLEALDGAHRDGTLSRLARLDERVAGLPLADPEELLRVGALTRSLSEARASAERRIEELADGLNALRRAAEEAGADRSQIDARMLAMAAALEGQQKRLEEQAAGLDGASASHRGLQESLEALRDDVQKIARRPDTSGDVVKLSELLARLASQIEAAEASVKAVREAAAEEATSGRARQDEALRALTDSLSESRREAEEARRDATAARAEIARLRDDLAAARAVSASQAASTREALSGLREELAREVARALDTARAPLEERLSAAEKRTKGLAENLRRALEELG